MGEASARGWRLAACVLVGMISALIGMLPWLVHGSRLVIQNLWATPVDSADMPVVLFPFSQYQLDLVAGIVVVGSLIAGVAARLLSARGVRGCRTAVIGGLLLVQCVALVQTAAAVASGLRFGGGAGLDDATVYLVAVTGWIVLAIGLGVLAFVLLTRRSSAPLPIAAALASIVLESWVRGFIVPLAPSSFVPPGRAGLFVATWLPAPLLGAAIGWAGLWAWSRAPGGPAATPRVLSVGRIASAIAALVLFWVGASMLAGLVTAAGSRALLRLPDELARLMGSVTAAEMSGNTLMVTAVAAVIGLVGVATHEVLVRSTRRPG